MPEKLENPVGANFTGVKQGASNNMIFHNNYFYNCIGQTVPYLTLVETQKAMCPDPVRQGQCNRISFLVTIWYK